MTDLSRLLRDALPDDPAPLDLPAVTARSLQMTRRRRATAGGAAAVVVTTAAVAFAASAPSQRADRLGPAVAPTTTSPSDATPSPRLQVDPAKEQACRHVRLAAAEYSGDALQSGVDFTAVEAAMTAAWRAGRAGSDREFVRNLIAPGAVAPGDTQTLGDAVSRLAGLCGLTPTGLKAPDAQRLDRTDEFGAVTSAVRLADGSLRVQVNRVDWLSGQEAQAAAAADGTDTGDYYVVDDNPRTRAYDISPTAKVYGSIGLTGVPDLSARTLDDLSRFLSDGSRAMAGQNVEQQLRGAYFHFQIDDGVVVGVEEQYRP